MQMSYNRPVGMPGALAENGLTDIKSYPIGEDIPFGAGFLLNAIGQAVPPAAAADAAKVKGIAMRSGDIPNHAELDYPFYRAGETMAGLVKGRAWVVVEEAVEPGDAVHIRHAAEEGKPSGIFGKAGTGKAAVSGWTFQSKTYFRTFPALTSPTGSATRSTLGYAMIEV